VPFQNFKNDNFASFLGAAAMAVRDFLLGALLWPITVSHRLQTCSFCASSRFLRSDFLDVNRWQAMVNAVCLTIGLALITPPGIVRIVQKGPRAFAKFDDVFSFLSTIPFVSSLPI
jgi:hypothetical protein